MCAKDLRIILILFSVFPVLLLQQIFENSKESCEYINYNVTEKEDIKVEIQNEFWNIGGTGRNLAIRVFLSPCGEPLPPTTGCGPGAVVCIINTKNSRKSILNAGKYFEYTVDQDKSKSILQSIDGQRCSSDENYTVIVEFDCLPLMKATPTFLYKDDCELRIRIMKPTCTPTCTTRINGKLIDLRQLQPLGNRMVHEPSTNNSFLLSFCNAAKDCGAEDVTVCKITGAGNTALADINNQRITYEPYTNNLVIKSHFGMARTRINTEIDIKCNWNVEGIANLQYIVPSKKGKRYQFKAESSLACIKLPMNCVIKENFERYWVYNLTSLYKPNGNWKVKNTMNPGNIYINICGPLQMQQPNHNCSDQYSQVCYANGTKQFINLGSVPIEFQISNDDTVIGKFVDGGICAVNPNLTYSTEIQFMCSPAERGPILNSIHDCTYKLKWETPAACSKQFVTSETCQLSDVAGTIDLRSFHKSSDRIYNFSPTSYLRYNLCGPLNKPCNKNKDVSVCYVKNAKEYVVGSSNMKLIRNNALLSLILQGEKCNLQTVRKTTIYFHCNHSAPPDGNVRINMVKENCEFEMNIDTPLVCTLPSFTECKIYKDNFVFDLTPLSRNSSNYIVRDSNSNFVYIINVCRSVINFDDSLCPPGTGACMNNLTAPHMKHKYLSMGNLNDKSAPIIEDGQLVIHYTAGFLCKETLTKRSTVIRFQCFNREEGPKLLKKDSCSHEFLWQTPKACGKRVLSVKTRETNAVCKYLHPPTGKSIDLGKIHKTLRLTPKDGEFYEFSLCEKNYTHCTSNGTDCKFLTAEVQLLTDEIDSYLEYSLKNQCTDINSQANKLRIYLKCSTNLSQGNEHFNVTGISNCTLYINLLTSLACASKESPLPLSVPTKTEVVIKTLKEHDVQINTVGYDVGADHATNISVYHNDTTSRNTPQLIMKTIDNDTSSAINQPLPHNPLTTSTQKECVINNTKTSSELNLKNIKPIYVQSSTGFTYTVSMNNSLSTCGGYICKNNLQIVSKTDECPAIEYNNTYSVIKLLYNSKQQCDGSNAFHSEIWLKCNSSVEQPSILREEKCNVIITYPLQDACSLLISRIETSSSTAELSIYSSVGLFVIIMLIVGGVLIFKKYPPNNLSRSCYQQIPEDPADTVVHFKMKEM